MRYDTSQLSKDVIRLAKIPAGSSYRVSETLLGIATDQLEQRVVPELLKVPGGHLMAHADVAIVAGKARYRFPARAIRPERLQIVNSAGKMLGSLRLASGEMVDEVLAGRCPPGSAEGYWCPENSHAVVVFNRSTMGGTYLRIYFRRQPNRLIEMAACYQITSFTPATTVAAQLEWSKDLTGNLNDPAEDVAYDFIKGSLPFECTGENITLQSISDPVAEFLGGTESGTEAGDYFAPAGYSPFPQLPMALHGVLAKYTAAEIMQENGNRAGADAMRAEAFATLTTSMSTVTPRSEEAETVVNTAWD